MIEKNFDIPFIADLALREKQIQQNYRPINAVHKWFARRPGTFFGVWFIKILKGPLFKEGSDILRNVEIIVKGRHREIHKKRVFVGRKGMIEKGVVAEKATSPTDPTKHYLLGESTTG